MKKVSHYNGDALWFHEKVLNSKRNSNDDPGYKQRMNGMINVTASQFIEYDTRFANDKLEGMSHLMLSEDEVEDFLKLYRYKDARYKELIEMLSCDEKLHEYPYCPLCDIGEAHSLDHILPKGEFPVLCDHPRNLIRSCRSCNGWKSEIWLENGKRKFLNLYIDDVPYVQMLFVNFGFDDGIATYEYYTSDVNQPDANLYRMYKNSFEKLHLDTRYAKFTSEEISLMVSRFKYSIRTYHATDDQLKEDITATAIDEQARHGLNYWRAILKLAICADDNMFAWMKNKALS